MQIDDYERAIALSEKLKAAIPFRVRPQKPLLQTMKEDVPPVTDQTWMDVTSLFYGGDEGGITVALDPISKTQPQSICGIPDSRDLRS